MTMEADSQPLVEVVCIDKLLHMNESIRVPPGTILLEALKKVGFTYGPCGGLGQCGRCVVQITDGRLVQACFYTVRENITVQKWRGL
jgi:ferredoxin